MRPALAALGLTVLLGSLSAVHAFDPGVDASVATRPSGAAAPGAPTDPAANSEDAIRHAKRAACRKDARDKKLVGAQKTAYIKDCTAAP